VKFIAGSLCLDFTNTVGGRTDTVLRDKLLHYSDLLEFAHGAGDISAARVRLLQRAAAAQPARAVAILTRARELREALYRIFRGSVEGRRPAPRDLQILSSELSTARSHERLAPAGRVYTWAWDDESALDRVLWPVARSAAALLTSPDLKRVRRCGGFQCGWLFLDTSRNHTRRWCSMEDCGNRAKVKRFREREQRQE
jgi:predicted RNA-binding Zn ribbon-like protein